MSLVSYSFVTLDISITMTTGKKLQYSNIEELNSQIQLPATHNPSMMAKAAPKLYSAAEKSDKLQDEEQVIQSLQFYYVFLLLIIRANTACMGSNPC